MKDPRLMWRTQSQYQCRLCIPQTYVFTGSPFRFTILYGEETSLHRDDPGPSTRVRPKSEVNGVPDHRDMSQVGWANRSLWDRVHRC